MSLNAEKEGELPPSDWNKKQMAKRLEAEFFTIENGGHLQDSDGFINFGVLLDKIKTT